MLVIQRFYLDLVIFSSAFSILFCILCSAADSLISFWVFLELCGLSIISSFFYANNISIYGFYGSLLTYIIISGLSSVLLMAGILFLDLYYFIFVGFALKFGLFPFSLWVYRVLGDSNWAFIFFLSAVLKFPVLFFCFLFQGCELHIILIDSGLTILMCTIFFWSFSCNWNFIWCHMSLSSVCTLLVGCFCSGFNLCLTIYFYYLLWSLLCIIYFSYLVDTGSFISKFWIYCFLLLVTPVSLPLFYKLGVCVAIFYSSFYMLVIWGLYSFSEQMFLYKLASSYFYSSVYNSWTC